MLFLPDPDRARLSFFFIVRNCDLVKTASGGLCLPFDTVADDPAFVSHVSRARACPVPSPALPVCIAAVVAGD